AVAERLGTVIITTRVAREVECDLVPAACGQPVHYDMPVVLACKAEVLEGRPRASLQEVADEQAIFFAHARAGHGIDPGHYGTHVSIWSLGYSQRGAIAGILRNIVRFRTSKPSVVGRSPLEIARRPNPMREAGWPFHRSVSAASAVLGPCAFRRADAER